MATFSNILSEMFAYKVIKLSEDGIEDAPSDGEAYVRKDGEWSQKQAVEGMTDPPSDDQLYVRKNATWVAI